MKYAETIERLEEQFKQENERKMAISEQMEEHRNKGFFYRVTHWREYRGLRRSFNEVDKLGDALSLDLDHYRELKYENQVNTANDFGNQVFEEIKQYAAEQGLYLAKDVELSVSSEDAVEENPKMTDYNWIIKHGDTHTDVLTVSSVEELREKIESYGDMIPFSPEEQEQIVREIESKVGLFEDERVSLQNSDQGVQVVISDNDQFGNGSNLLDKKISYEELSERIQIDGKENTDPYKKISLNLDLELEVQTRKNIDAAEQHFAEKGLYPSNRIGVMPPGPMGSGITLFVEADAYVAEDDSFTKIPTKDQIIGFVEENNLLTRISPEEQKALLEELNKITYESDENVHSYSTFVGDLEEHEGVPYFRVFDDTDKVFDYLTYDAETDNWVGDKNDFKIKNPVPSIREKYQDLALEKTRSDYEKQIHQELQEIAQKMGKRIPEEKLPSLEIAPYIHTVEDLDVTSHMNVLLQNETDGKMDILQYKSANELFEKMVNIGLVDKLEVESETVKVSDLGSSLDENPKKNLSETLKKMNKTELELMQLIDNAKNEGIDNYYADWGASSNESSKALDEFVERLQNSEIYNKVKSIYEKMIHGYIDTPPKDKVDMGIGGRMISNALEEKNTEFFGLKEDKRVIEGDPKLLGYRWGLSFNKQERKGEPSLEDFVSEGDRYRAGKSIPGGEQEVAFHVWTMTEGVDAQGNPRLLSKEGTLKLMDEILEKEQTIERAEELPDGWNWRTFSDGSGSLLSPKGDHYFSFKEFALGGKVVTNPETGEFDVERNFDQFKKNSEQWISEAVLGNSIRKEETQSLQGRSESEVELEM